jgi:hypothetical protein
MICVILRDFGIQLFASSTSVTLPLPVMATPAPAPQLDINPIQGALNVVVQQVSKMFQNSLAGSPQFSSSLISISQMPVQLNVNLSKWILYYPPHIEAEK